MDNLSLVELKALAKERRIKHYYIMRRAQLLELLAASELPRALILEKKTILELRQEAKERGMRGFWRMPRERLLALLYPESEQQNQNQSHADQHNKPQRHDPNHVGVDVSKNPLQKGA